jgi:Ca2+-binding EF-hand superfamily protein
MGSGVSNLSKENVLETVRNSYEKDSIWTVDVINECRKEVVRLSKKRFVPSSSEEELYFQFQEMDYNGNNLISLAEIDKLILERYPQFDHKPALIRAYYAADKNNTGLITFDEFKDLWKYIIFYNEMWEKFSKYDSDRDRRINVNEFIRMSHELFETELSDREAKFYFNLIDANNGGFILFKEFCTFMVRRKIALQ